VGIVVAVVTVTIKDTDTTWATVTTKENTILCQPTNPHNVILPLTATVTTAASNKKTATKYVNMLADHSVARVERVDTTVSAVLMMMVFTVMMVLVSTVDTTEEREAKVERVEVSDVKFVKQSVNLFTTNLCHITGRLWSFLFLFV